MSTEYSIKIEKNKNIAICRNCQKKINPRELAVKTKIDDGYSVKGMQFHLYCLLDRMINDIIKIKEEELKKEIKKFKDIKNILK